MSWRLVFWINVPLCITILLIIQQAVKNAPAAASHKKLDWAGFITLIITTATLVLALMEGNSFGWRSTFIVSLLGIAMVFGALFYFCEKRAEEALIDFSIFKNKIFAGGVITYFCIQITIMSMVFGAIYNQDVLGFQPAIAGLLSLPGTLPVTFMGPMAGNMLDKYGVRRPVVIGLVLTLIGITLNSFMVHYQNYFYLLPGLLCNGFGIPLIMSPMGTAVISSIEQSKQGVASGMLNASRQLGSCIGLALLSAIIISYNQHNLANFLTTHQQAYPQVTVNQLENLLNHIGNHQLTSLLPIAKASFASAYGFGLHICSIFLLIALVMSWRLLKPEHK